MTDRERGQRRRTHQRWRQLLVETEVQSCWQGRSGGEGWMEIGNVVERGGDWKIEQHEIGGKNVFGCWRYIGGNLIKNPISLSGSCLGQGSQHTKDKVIQICKRQNWTKTVFEMDRGERGCMGLVY